MVATSPSRWPRSPSQHLFAGILAADRGTAAATDSRIDVKRSIVLRSIKNQWRKVTSQKPGGNFRQPQSEAEDRTIWPCRDHERRSSYHRRIFFEVPIYLQSLHVQLLDANRTSTSLENALAFRLEISDGERRIIDFAGPCRIMWKLHHAGEQVSI